MRENVREELRAVAVAPLRARLVASKSRRVGVAPKQGRDRGGGGVVPDEDTSGMESVGGGVPFMPPHMEGVATSEAAGAAGELERTDGRQDGGSAAAAGRSSSK